MSGGDKASITNETSKSRKRNNIITNTESNTIPYELPVITNLTPEEFTSESDFRTINLANKVVWHEFQIFHSKVKTYNKSDVLNSLFNIVKQSKFIPIAYRENPKFDSFFVRDCAPAIKRISADGFKLEVPFDPANGQITKLNIKLRLEVDFFEENHINVEKQLTLTFNRLIKKLVTNSEVASCLDCSNFVENPEFRDIIFNLNNNTNQSSFATSLRRATHNIKHNIKGLIFSNNNLTATKTLQIALVGHFPSLELIDFSNNNLQSAETLIQDKRLWIKHIIITGNPFVTQNSENYRKKIVEYFPNIRITDKLSTQPVDKPPTPTLVFPPKIIQKPAPFKLPPTLIPQSPLYPSKIAAATNKIPPVRVLSIPTKGTTTSTITNPLPQQKSPINPQSAKILPTKSVELEIPEVLPQQTIANSSSNNKTTNKIIITTNSTSTMPSSKSTSSNSSTISPTEIINTRFQATQLGDEINTGDLKNVNQFFFRKYKISTMWHQVIINHDGKYKKPIILQSIFKAILPNDFYPCYYMEDKHRDSFFVRNSYEQLEQLYNDNLILKIVNDSLSLTESLFKTQSETINLTLRMNVAEYKQNSMDPKNQIQKCLCLRYNLLEKTLNFENFASHPEFVDVELNLSHPPVMAHILLHSSRRFLSNIEVLKLNDNGLVTTNGMRPIIWMKSIKSIDLSNNKFESISSLESLPKLPAITDVYLHDNPFSKEMAPLEYIAKIRELFPLIKTLDGHELTNACMNVSQKNYLCSLDGYDLVEQFVKQYFTTYDLSGRPQIKNLYTDKAIMTISSNFTGISNKCDTQVRRYISRSRNLLKMINKNTAIVTTFEGNNMIEGVWRSFGKTEHDFQSFTIDLTSYSETSAIFTVNGLFKEHGATLNEEEITLGFVRTFVLRKDQSGLGLFGNSIRYKIANEQVLIYRPSIYQINNSFGHRNVPMELEEELSEEERESLIVIFQELTQLIPLWCIRFLEQAQWQFRSGLEIFVKLLEEDKVPDEAFSRY